MSYNVNLTLENGVTIAYVKLNSISIDVQTKHGAVVVDFYVSKDANDTGKLQVISKTYSIDFTGLAGLNALRTFVKNKLMLRPEFSNLTDA